MEHQLLRYEVVGLVRHLVPGPVLPVPTQHVDEVARLVVQSYLFAVYHHVSPNVVALVVQEDLVQCLRLIHFLPAVELTVV